MSQPQRRLVEHPEHPEDPELPEHPEHPEHPEQREPALNTGPVQSTHHVDPAHHPAAHGSRSSFAGLPEADSEWRRLSPRMLLIHPIREAGRALPALFGLLIAGTSQGQGEWWALGAAGLVALLSLLRWFTTRYRITADQVQLRTGLLRKKSLATPADRVRTVDVTANLMHRALGLAKVEIGTARVDKKDQLALDALPKDAAMRLREELLHRRVTARPAEGAAGRTYDAAGTPTGPEQGPSASSGTSMPANGQPEAQLLALDPRWIRYAPFTMSGFIAALTIVGFGSRIISDIGDRLGQNRAVESTAHQLTTMSIWLVVLLAAVALLLLVMLLSLGGYVLSFWGFRLSRHEGGTLHVARGLLTTRATSIEERRLRGVQLVEPILLRMVHGARLMAVSTGLKTKGREDGGSNGALLVPPAPVDVARSVAGQVIRDDQVLGAKLLVHGPAARRRRYTRALAGNGVLVLLAVLVWRPGIPGWSQIPGVVPVMAALVLLPAGFLLARDRFASLGHALTRTFLLCRIGSVVRRTTALQREGIIGWNISQSYFQRRAGICDLVATTAAGRQSYAVQDLEVGGAVDLADQAVPGLVSQFLA